MINAQSKQKKRPLTAVSYLLFFIGAVCLFLVANRVRFQSFSSRPSQLFIQMEKAGLKAKLQSEDNETQLEAIEDLAWAIEVNPEDKQIARLTFGNELNLLSKSQNTELAKASNTLLKQLGGR